MTRNRALKNKTDVNCVRAANELRHRALNALAGSHTAANATGPMANLQRNAEIIFFCIEIAHMRMGSTVCVCVCLVAWREPNIVGFVVVWLHDACETNIEHEIYCRNTVQSNRHMQFDRRRDFGNFMFAFDLFAVSPSRCSSIWFSARFGDCPKVRMLWATRRPSMMITPRAFPI